MHPDQSDPFLSNWDGNENLDLGTKCSLTCWPGLRVVRAKISHYDKNEATVDDVEVIETECIQSGDENDGALIWNKPMPECEGAIS